MRGRTWGKAYVPRDGGLRGQGGYRGDMPPGHDDAGERILDLALYAPLGLVISVLEAMPDLVRKGRERLGPQVGMARTVGQFAVHQGYRQVAGMARSRARSPSRSGLDSRRPRPTPSTPPSRPEATTTAIVTVTVTGMVTAPIKPFPRRPCRPVRPHPWGREPPTSVPSNWPYPVTTRCQPRKWSNV